MKALNTGHPSDAARTGRQIAFLDVIRFGAALLVLCFHLGFRSFLNYPLGWHTVVSPYARVGWVGVPIFFVLSGFVIAYSAAKTTPTSFLKSRVLRLYPAVWICSSITFLFLLHVSGMNLNLLRSWADALTLSPFGPLIDGSYWTLRVEMSFYLLIYLLLLSDWFQFIGQAILAVSAVSISCLALGYAVDHSLLKTGSFAQGIPAFLVGSRWARLLLVDYAPHFAIGVLLWLLFFHGVSIFRLAAFAFCCFGALLSLRVEWREVVLSSRTPSSLAFSILIWTLALVAIVLSVKYNNAIVQWLGPALTARTRTLGLITYPLYLLHQGIADVLVQRLDGRIPDAAIVLLATAISIGLAYSVVSYAEKPIQNHLRRLLNGVRPPLPISTVP